jgi:hypothetical protein
MNSKALAMAILAAGNCLAFEKVTVCLTSSHDEPALEHAQLMASKMFRGAGVELEWRASSRECRTADRQGIVVDLLEKQPKDAGRLSLARAYVYEGVHIEIFEPQVSGKDGIDPVLLSHVMAHEITHILQGVPRHSDTGVMKATWTHDDYALMHYKPLAFAPEDIELIHIGLMHREAVPVRLRDLSRTTDAPPALARN